MNEWIGVGCLLRRDIHPYFLLIQLTPNLIQGLKRVIMQVASVEGYEGLEAIALSASSEYSDEADHSVFVVPASDWKLVGKDAAMQMWQETSTLIRVSADHAQYMKMSSIDISPRASFEIGRGDLAFDVCIHVNKDAEDVELLYAHSSIATGWVEHWAEHGIGGAHGQAVSDAITHPQAPAIPVSPQSEVRQSANVNPTQPPTPAAEVEEEEEAEVVPVGDCDVCGNEFPVSELRDDICTACGSECEICHEFFDRDDMYDDARVCADCAVWCTDCNELFHPNSIVDEICRECRAENYTQCSECQQLTLNTDMIGGVCASCAVMCQHCEDYYEPSLVNSAGFCSDCTELVQACTVCNEYTEKTEMVGDSVCTNCAVRCSFCDEYHSPTTLSDGVCGDCVVHTAHCADCGERFEMEDLNDGMLCFSCADAAKQCAVATSSNRRRR